MIYSYDAIITKEEGGYFARFPQLPDAFTQGSTREEVIANAAEVLTLVLSGIIDEGGTPPEMRRTAEVVSVCVDVTDEMVRGAKCITNTEAAEELGVSVDRVDQLVKAGLLERAHVNGKPMVTIESINAQKTGAPMASHPSEEVIAE